MFKKGVADDSDLIVVMEDDVILSRRLTGLLQKLAFRQGDGEVVTLGNLIFAPIEFFKAEDVVDGFALCAAKSYENLYGTQAYALTKNTAITLVDFLDPVSSIADDWNKYVNLGWLKTIRVALPFPVKHAELISTVNKSAMSTVPFRTRVKIFFTMGKYFLFIMCFCFFGNVVRLKGTKNIFLLMGEV